ILLAGLQALDVLSFYQLDFVILGSKIVHSGLGSYFFHVSDCSNLTAPFALFLFFYIVEHKQKGLIAGQYCRQFVPNFFFDVFGHN
ncbi:hypothetical protein ACJX0J_005730, partial [Zea mays]